MPEANSVLYCGLNEITFSVDDVKPSKKRFAKTSVWKRVEKLTGHPLQAASHAPNFSVVEDQGHHALLSAVHLAFSQHLPLSITPDVIWLTIAQGFAQHVNNHAEELRALLVKHEGKMRIEAAVLDPDDWIAAVEQWTDGMDAYLPPCLVDMLLCDFSTTTPTIRTASQMVMMEAFHPYFDFVMICICGIPQITLYGTVEDWRSIRRRVERLAEYQLSWWTDRLLPLCDAFIATAEGQPSREFWQEIYKPEASYGGEAITGWIVELFPYVVDEMKAPTIRNPLFDRIRHKKNPLLAKARKGLVSEDGLSAGSFPLGLSVAPITLEFGRPVLYKKVIELLGGFLGVTQNSQTGCLQPELGWVVQEQNAFANVLSRLAQDHSLIPPTYSVHFDEMVNVWGKPAEFFQMLDCFDGGVLFADTAHAWKLRPCRDYTWHDIIGPGPCTCFLDLPDGRIIGYSMVGIEEEGGSGEIRHECWIVVGRQETGVNLFNETTDILHPEKITVIAGSLCQFFQRVLQADGRYYFDRPDFVPDAPSLPDEGCPMSE